jgi:DNA polymerase-3 subunit delta
MTAIKAQQAEQFLKTLDLRYRAILLYGTDAGVIAERARTAAKKLAESSDPPGDILRIEDADLEVEPDRLLVEAQTIPMFGGPKVIHTRASRRVTAQVLQPLLQEGALAGALVVEAGNLRPDDSLRLLFEKSANAAAIACFADESRTLDSIISETLEQAGITITRDARQALLARLGADRALTRGELEKLVLYTRGKSQIDIDDVDAIVGDASELAIETVVLAAASGEGRRAVQELDRVIAAGESPQTVIAAVQRHMQRLHRLRASLESGHSMDAALRQLRPPVHFKTRPHLEAQCRMWAIENLNAALSRIADAAKEARLNSALEATIAERLLLDLARSARGSASARTA